MSLGTMKCRSLARTGTRRIWSTASDRWKSRKSLEIGSRKANQSMSRQRGYFAAKFSGSRQYARETGGGPIDHIVDI